MRVAYDAQIFLAQRYGGISRYFYEIATRINEQDDFDARIISPFSINKYVPNSNLFFNNFYLNGGGKFSEISNLISRGLGSMMCDISLRRFNPQIIHETYFMPFGMGPKKIPRVLTIYDMIPEKFPLLYSGSEKLLNYKKKAAARAHHIICISEATRNDVIDILNISPEKTSVIYLGHELLKKSSSALINISTNKPFILYVGNRRGYKNFSGLLKAYASSNELHSSHNLICFGGGVFSDVEKAEIHSLGFYDDQIQQISGGDEILSEVYSKARVFVYPSLYEGFGIPPLEAMGFGCPVACSNTGSIPEVAGTAAQYFDPLNIESMRDAILLLINSEGRRSNLIAEGFIRAESFSWSKCSYTTANLYKSLLL